VCIFVSVGCRVTRDAQWHGAHQVRTMNFLHTAGRFLGLGGFFLRYEFA